ncbi:hypothetical protein SAMN06265348_101132 [Pedobacter westerhofensis]|uniref:Uncharacterized protein n=1 Tax=Pedobacter westerhofensis TaxID=425512 RepID=A0A521AFJ4_9SPHI|nr:hypothetical protein SAMN06265348_101132 [Pedobacter westerhofensis]
MITSLGKKYLVINYIVLPVVRIIQLSVLLFFLQLTALCQPARRDSIIRAARNDAKKFRLDDAVWKKYRRALPATSNYFNPVGQNQKNQTLLNDSLYVKTYRKAAYKHNRGRRTPLHYVIVGTGILAAAAVAGAIVLLIALGPNMN